MPRLGLSPKGSQSYRGGGNMNKPTKNMTTVCAWLEQVGMMEAKRKGA